MTDFTINRGDLCSCGRLPVHHPTWCRHTGESTPHKLVVVRTPDVTGPKKWHWVVEDGAGMAIKWGWSRTEANANGRGTTALNALRGGP